MRGRHRGRVAGCTVRERETLEGGTLRRSSSHISAEDWRRTESPVTGGRLGQDLLQEDVFFVDGLSVFFSSICLLFWGSRLFYCVIVLAPTPCSALFHRALSWSSRAFLLHPCRRVQQLKKSARSLWSFIKPALLCPLTSGLIPPETRGYDLGGHEPRVYAAVCFWLCRRCCGHQLGCVGVSVSAAAGSLLCFYRWLTRPAFLTLLTQVHQV